MMSSNKCEDFVKAVLSNNAKLKQLINTDPMKLRINCRRCDTSGIEGNARAFLIDSPLEIVLCTNKLLPSDIEEVLVHESIHAYDLFQNRYDFNSCDGLASTEIRAAREAECKNSFFLVKDSCIKKHATRSTANLFPKEAEQCIEKVFHQAVNDLAPHTTIKPVSVPVVDNTPVVPASQSGTSMPYSSLFGPPRKS